MQCYIGCLPLTREKEGQALYMVEAPTHKIPTMFCTVTTYSKYGCYSKVYFATRKYFIFVIEFWKITHMTPNDQISNFIVQIYLLMVLSHFQYVKLQENS